MYRIELIDISKKFGAVEALKSVTLKVEEGASCGLVGGSGCGKTTLARIALGLIKPDSGQIIYKDGFSRKDYQIVFQNPYTSLNPRMKVGEVIKEPLDIHKLDLNIDEILDSVGLPASYKNKYPHELSGGERQRLCIARAVCIEPKLIVLDEPVSSLDMKVQLEILKLLKELRKKHKLTYLFISHDISVIRYMCDNVVVMDSGLIIEKGLVSDVLTSPINDYTKELLNSIPAL